MRRSTVPHPLGIRGVDRNTLVQHLVCDRMAFIHPANVTFARRRPSRRFPPGVMSLATAGGKAAALYA